MTDIQAAIGSAQMDKLSDFCEQRKENFKRWSSIFLKYEKYFILPQATENSDPAWFSFIVSLKESCPFTRDELTRHLNQNLIETRNLFAGNISKQPAFVDKAWLLAEHLDNTDFVMNNTFFLGTYPNLTEDMFLFCEKILDQFIESVQ